LEIFQEGFSTIICGAGIGVFFRDGHPLNMSDRVSGCQTNNRAEILAIVYAIEGVAASGCKKVKVRTDSQFTIDCVKQWMPTWKQNGWKKSNGDRLPNEDEIKLLDKAINKMNEVILEHVPGHSGNYGNNQTDKLAKQGATKPLPGY
jgi:ribonuclease HI